MKLLFGLIVFFLIGFVLVIAYLAEKDRYCPKCKSELRIWSYKKSICKYCGFSN